jgi:hypothetical protein
MLDVSRVASANWETLQGADDDYRSVPVPLLYAVWVFTMRAGTIRKTQLFMALRTK